MDFIDLLALFGIYKASNNKQKLEDLNLEYKLEDDENKKDIIFDEIKKIEKENAELNKKIMKIGVIILVAIPVFFMILNLFLYSYFD